MINIQLMTEFGLSVPALSYYALFNTAPWWLKVTTSTACVALPHSAASPSLYRVTVEVRVKALGHLKCVGMSTIILLDLC